jgi:hypothetical protein
MVAITRAISRGSKKPSSFEIQSFFIAKARGTATQIIPVAMIEDIVIPYCAGES